MEQFNEDSMELSNPTCQHSNIQSVSNTSNTNDADAAIGPAAAAAVCMETSFGVSSDEPRTHILPNVRSDYSLSLQLAPGLLKYLFILEML